MGTQIGDILNKKEENYVGEMLFQQFCVKIKKF